MSTPTEYHVSLYVYPETSEALARSTEVMARCLAGLALEGLTASVDTGSMRDDEGDEG